MGGEGSADEGEHDEAVGSEEMLELGHLPWGRSGRPWVVSSCLEYGQRPRAPANARVGRHANSRVGRVAYHQSAGVRRPPVRRSAEIGPCTVRA